MVAFVIVSHSAKLADGVADLAAMSAPEVVMLPAGGLSQGGYGTDYQLIADAVAKADNPDGVIVLADMGSALLTAEIVLEDLSLPNVKLSDCPLVAGAVTGSVLSAAGSTLEEIEAELAQL